GAAGGGAALRRSCHGEGPPSGVGGRTGTAAGVASAAGRRDAGGRRPRRGPGPDPPRPSDPRLEGRGPSTAHGGRSPRHRPDRRSPRRAHGRRGALAVEVAHSSGHPAGGWGSVGPARPPGPPTGERVFPCFFGRGPSPLTFFGWQPSISEVSARGTSVTVVVAQHR